MTDTKEKVIMHMQKALEALTDEFNIGRAGPSGLRAQAIAHIRQALLIATRDDNCTT